MLRINLLPAYIAERQKVRNTLIACVIGFLAVVGGMLGYQFAVLGPALDKRVEEANQRQSEADAEVAYESQTSTIRTQIKPLQEKVDFVKFVQYYNTLPPRIYRQAAAYTYREVEYNQMAINGNTLSVSAYVKNIADIGRFYITFYGNPDVTAVSISGIPSWPEGTVNNPQVPGQPVPPALRSFPVALTATLAKPVSPPALPASLQAGAAGGAPGAPISAPAPAAPAPDGAGSEPDAP